MDAQERREDLDEVIRVASELEEADRRRLSADELREVCVRLGVDESYVQRTFDELDRRRVAGAAARSERRRRIVLAASGAAVIAAVVAGLAAAGQASLRSSLAVVEQHRAQVRTVVERREAVRVRWERAATGPERDAELSGSDNRVAIERRRYDEAAAGYNARAGSFPGALWVGLFPLPDRVPLSNEVESW